MNYTLTLPDNYVPPPLPGGRQWVEALRSGLYQQCTGQLCDGTGYCCLGVLSKVQGRLIEHDVENATDGSEGPFMVLSATNPMRPYLNASGKIPKGVIVEAEHETRGVPKGPARELTSLNDAGLTFPQIADIIEAVWACE